MHSFSRLRQRCGLLSRVMEPRQCQSREGRRHLVHEHALASGQKVLEGAGPGVDVEAHLQQATA
eukprot:2351487-Rhodomonas_salina.3